MTYSDIIPKKRHTETFRKIHDVFGNYPKCHKISCRVTHMIDAIYFSEIVTAYDNCGRLSALRTFKEHVCPEAHKRLIEAIQTLIR